MEITEKRISEKLRSLGVPANILGFGYIKTALMLIFDDENYLHSITKRLYPTIAKQHNTTADRVQRAIRHAVDKVCLYGDIEEIHMLVTGYEIKGKLTNSEFLGELYECMKFEE